MNFIELRQTGLLVSSYLLITIILLAEFTGFWGITILALPIFISELVEMNNKNSSSRWTATSVTMQTAIVSNDLTNTAAV